MDIERDKRRIQALDKGADGLSKQIRVLKKKSEEIVNLIHELSSGYKKHIHDSDAFAIIASCVDGLVLLRSLQ